jgi:biopolymer transport protein ExbD
MIERESPEINAGSMADIAFLLLIFFLVTTTMDTEIGIFKMLPDKNLQSSFKVNERNVLEININSKNEIFIEGHQLTPIENVRQLVADFIDNGGGTDAEGNKCTWCQGKQQATASGHPAKAIIKLQSNRNTSYAQYIAVQNEITGAYSQLRNRLSTSLYGISYTDLVAAYKRNKNDKVTHAKIVSIKEKYPQHILEEEPLQQ